jgi:hypothetical protein
VPTKLDINVFIRIKVGNMQMVYYICNDFTLVKSTGVFRFSFDAIKEVPLVDNEAETDSTIVKGLKGLNLFEIFQIGLKTDLKCFRNASIKQQVMTKFDGNIIK